jgi:hypothetical protein
LRERPGAGRTLDAVGLTIVGPVRVPDHVLTGLVVIFLTRPGRQALQGYRYQGKVRLNRLRSATRTLGRMG